MQLYNIETHVKLLIIPNIDLLYAIKFTKFVFSKTKYAT